MEKYMEWNEPMQKLLLNRKKKKRGKGKVSFKISKLKEMLLPDLRVVEDCIIIYNENQSVMDEEEKLKVYIANGRGNRTSYEASENEIYINYFVKGENYTLRDLMEVALILIDVLGYQLKQLEPESKFCFPVSCDPEFNSVTMWFHKVREEDGMWLVENLDLYKEPIGYVII